ncbi:MarR family winged helix-turn-helix transcriptional regulator [Saccharopolyspora phatthalungensis]|uniref:DNA-binding MarR family transcriptional regulator n=1 Tax=Saccharopolyspora phatthalungensis TaxID=664693 RepID=A0A840Q3L5_9PSEU|nr:MarR family winged helix-turn-helix transcriptional regulator [Saccharopolyspora phatthalungensis]MBB5154577.1 DNA-binding MarR family transcriptional regulator [Saccharopolyspora phatthalungensis]
MAAEIPRPGVAFLLTQLGTHAAMEFGGRVGALDLTPPQVGMLRMIAARPGLSQQALAGALGMLPSKVVSFVDDLEDRGLVTRTRSTRDRRVHELTLTPQGTELLGKVRAITATHEADFCQALDPDDYARLHTLLERLAESHGLTPGVHPGYRTIR